MRLENEIQVRTPTVTGPLFLYPALYTLIHTTHDIRNKTVNTVKQNQVVYFKVALPGVTVSRRGRSKSWSKPLRLSRYSQRCVPLWSYTRTECIIDIRQHFDLLPSWLTRKGRIDEIIPHDARMAARLSRITRAARAP